MLPAKAVTATQDTKIDESTTTGFLIISDVTSHDAGEYCCIASNEAGQIESDCVQLTVQIPPPRISRQPEDVTVGQGTSVSLNCEAESFGDTFYHWQRVDGEVDTSRASGINSKQLTIINTVPSDTGSYICVTRNQDGETISREAIITVTAQCPTNLNIQNGFVTVSGDNKLVAYGCYNGYRLVGNTTAKCLPDGTWNSDPPMCVADTCTDVGATNCAHFANVDDNGVVLCMCRPGYRVDLLNASDCVDVDECRLESTLCDGECVNTQGSYYCQCPPSFALASDGKTCIECGVSNVAVNGGNSGNVHRRKFSWHVQLCVNATNNNSSFLCSGSLINDQWVLTSAECICGLDYSNILIYLHKLAKCPVTQTNEIVRTISAVYCHVGYQNKVIDYNIALLKLSMPVNNNDTSPVCLPKDTTMRRDFPDFVHGVFVTGWGSSSHLRYSKLSTVPSNICKKSYGGDYDIETNSICTDKYDPNGSCDDGSPMVYQIKSTRVWFVMVGIANSKCQATLPYDVYTSTLPTTNVLPWIVKTTGLHI
ncbi:clotting factor C-like [Dysidea avara]|uniref:clotting factor C-like n=1 Tax=Dysidea avara TaxID=196820 RepID=UPI0033217EBF